MFLHTIRICPGLDKSTSDVAAEGAILNEMLDIVAKRASLRTLDGGGGASNNSNSRRLFESDVSCGAANNDWLVFVLQLAVLFACIWWYARIGGTPAA